MMSFIAFLSISISASFYFTNMKQKGEELQTIKDSFENLALLNNIVIDKMDHGFITTDFNGKIISSNVRAEKLINFSSRDSVFEILNFQPDNNTFDFPNNKTQLFIERVINLKFTK